MARDPVCPHSGGTEDVDRRLIEALECYIPRMMRYTGAPGLSLAIARHGEVIWERGFGNADLDQKTPMTPQTVIHAGSMCKVYTGTAVMQLAEAGVIGLYDPINGHLSEFQVVNPLDEREITFYDLLTHRSGLSANDACSDFLPPRPLGEHLKREFMTQPMMEPYSRSAIPRWGAKVGERFEYSNCGIAILGYLVEVTNPDGLSFPDYVQSHILDPLGMHSSQFPAVQDAAHIRPDLHPRLSTGYARIGPFAIPTMAIHPAEYPSATAVTTPGDHIRVGLAYLNGGTFGGHRLLRPETVRMMLTPQAPISSRGAGVDVGLVWHLSDSGGPNRSFGHSGAFPYGWRNGLICYPGEDLAVVVAANHWPMLMSTEGDAPRISESQLVVEFVRRWLRREEERSHRSPNPTPDADTPSYVRGDLRPSNSRWSWNLSYIAGMVMVERTRGSMGIPSPLASNMVDAMASGAYVRAEANSRSWPWDPEGFRTGVRDMLSVEMTPSAIQSFLESDRLQVGFEGLDLLYRELGSSGAPILGGILDSTYVRKK